ncbi:hypothetical protein R3P38DRAFT_2779728 [Favolaschia claudopus]|uniref:Uncharacterized protein n=1 Tax=Favolaschia claudopus TaxID=2862362 RepID=A0AAW0B9K4_9AGAR
MIEMQAGSLLSGMYATRVQTQFQAQETKQSRRKGKRKMGDGKAKYFKGDEFFKLAQEDEQRQREEEAGKEQRKVARDAHSIRLAEWKKENEEIRRRNEEKRQEMAIDVAAWELEKQEAKQEKRKVGWEKPKWKDYGPEKLLARPTKADKEDDDSDEESANESDVVD